MTDPAAVTFAAPDTEALAGLEGRIAVLAEPGARLDQVARRLNRLAKGAVERAVASPAFARLKRGDSMTLAWPAGVAAEAIEVVNLPPRPTAAEARKAGGALGRAAKGKPLTVIGANRRQLHELALGAVLRGYAFAEHKSKGDEAEETSEAAITVWTNKPEEARAAWARNAALAEGVFFTRDLVNEPANVLTTTEFAQRLTALADLGLEVEVLEEADLEKLGMGSLLSVGQGSASPSKVVVMQWKGGEKGAAPLALCGKGVVFDTGGISLKPAQGMEEMTMDMGGAGVVSGVMKALARRGAKANVVGLVGLVENMPSGTATRPGDVVKSMKGDTIEVINTDAEGRLVLADVMWYAQERFKPAGMIDLATLTGAMIIALGNEKAGLFSNDDPLCGALQKAADAEGEGAWRLPLGEAYDELLKSDIADMKNVGGRAAGSITAAQFLGRFVKEDTPWVHIDIAGVARLSKDTPLAPKGATGWGVMALDRLVADRFES
ncbi:leucyl aminopeptidase [Rhodosalinus halophilus]|uniref:Probable cytosol aminopeptidase n=1 Tax=Rhodosalinus halophilus TaxID=2259333 RepID=A0A365U4G3_9RHOB|nr:leucyl aminopeptidase [Rhodosalinus halophilus]RBI82939.1 leucyl aminopeptidase [Rhodosalinus halophilus]